MKKFLPGLFIITLLFTIGCREDAEMVCGKSYEAGTKEYVDCVRSFGPGRGK